ncbi:hypothetical protein EJB05_08773, partial [Eragrostis curvula]
MDGVVVGWRRLDVDLGLALKLGRGKTLPCESGFGFLDADARSLDGASPSRGGVLGGCTGSGGLAFLGDGSFALACGRFVALTGEQGLAIGIGGGGGCAVRKGDRALSAVTSRHVSRPDVSAVHCPTRALPFPAILSPAPQNFPPSLAPRTAPPLENNFPQPLASLHASLHSTPPPKSFWKIPSIHPYTEMASPPAAGLTDYERRREENIRRNEAILASLRREAAELSASFRTPSPKRRKKQQPAAPPQEKSPVVLRRSLRTRGLPPSGSSAGGGGASSSPATPPSPPTPHTTRISSSLAAALRAAAPAAKKEPAVKEERFDAAAPAAKKEPAVKEEEFDAVAPAAKEEPADEAFDPGWELVLRPADVRRVVPERILSVRILPLADRTVVAAGNKIGHIGFWDVDGFVEEDEEGNGADGVFEYFPHRGSVGAISVHPAAPRKIYSCSYQGEICLMDVEKETFNMIQLCDYPIFTLCQAPNSPSCLYFGEGNGELKLFDERMGKVATTWYVHEARINSIDFHPENPNMFATSSTDRTACLWDLRSMKKNGPESLKVFEHKRPVHSAYFSPSGGMVATTCLDDTVRIFNVDNYDISCVLKHNNQTGRWLSTFKAMWSWNDSDLFIGNMKRAIDIISVIAVKAVSRLPTRRALKMNT